MGRAPTKINPGDSHTRENSDGPDFEDDIRLQRRWNRRYSWNQNSRHNRHANAKRITVKSCGNSAVLTDKNGGCMVKDEVDEDYEMFLDKYVYHIDDVKDNNIDNSDIDAKTGYDCDYDDDPDPQYRMFLENLREEGNSYVFEAFVDKHFVHIRYEGDEEEQEVQEEEKAKEIAQEVEQDEERLHDELNCNIEVDVDCVDEDYQMYLNSCRIDGNSLAYEGSEARRKSSTVRQNSEVSDQAFNTPKVHCDIDGHYQQVSNRENGPCCKRPGSGVSSVPKHNCNDEVEFDSVDEDYQIYLNSCRIDGNSLVYEGSELKGNSSTLRQNSKVSDLAFDAPKVQGDIDEHYQLVYNWGNGSCNEKPGSDVSGVPNHNCNNEVKFDTVDEDYQIFLNSGRIDYDGLVYGGSELKGNSSAVRQNSLVSDRAFDTPKVQCDIDEHYHLFLNSARTDDENLVYMHERNVTKIYNVKDGCNSSDPELIILGPNQFCENTPFISSKMYDSSWFENERNPRDCKQLSGYDHSQFRKRLMEFLERPYDQEEYDLFLHEVSMQRQKERHRETRHGVVKRICVEGVNKSYRELYPDLDKVIDQVKEPHKVLFLLRGFIYWLQNLSQDGTFRPWLDASCLETLHKM